MLYVVSGGGGGDTGGQVQVVPPGAGIHARPQQYHLRGHSSGLHPHLAPAAAPLPSDTPPYVGITVSISSVYRGVNEMPIKDGGRLFHVFATQA